MWTVFDYHSGGGTEMQVNDQSLTSSFYSEPLEIHRIGHVFLILSVAAWILSIFDVSKDVAVSKSAFLLGLLHDTMMPRHF